jgi:hypothetical protein
MPFGGPLPRLSQVEPLRLRITLSEHVVSRIWELRVGRAVRGSSSACHSCRVRRDSHSSFVHASAQSATPSIETAWTPWPATDVFSRSRYPRTAAVRASRSWRIGPGRRADWNDVPDRPADAARPHSQPERSSNSWPTAPTENVVEWVAQGLHQYCDRL